MVIISHKAKQFGVFTIKLLVVIAAFYFIYHQLTTNDQLDWVKFWALFKEKQSVFGVLFLLSFSVVNRYLEILKWQNLVSFLCPISVGESAKQVLGALTAGIFTPNGLGEYAGKALYFDKTKTKKILFLNLICNGIQMILTIIFGTIGLWLLGFRFWFLGIIFLSFCFLLWVQLFKKIKIRGYSIQKILEKLNKIPKQIHQRNIFLAICRYLVFSHQYYFLFLAFGIDLPYTTLMSNIVVVYFLASSLPSFQFIDFAIKGSIAMFFFEKLGINNWIVVFITTLMWFLNVVLPAVIGSYYVLVFKINRKI